MSLVVHSTDDTTRDSTELNDAELNDHERLVLEDILTDINHKPFIKAFHRHGAYTFLVTAGNVAVSTPLAKQHVLQSHLTLDASESFCTLQLLKRIVAIACYQADVRLDSVVQRDEGAKAHYAYTITYQ